MSLDAISRMLTVVCAELLLFSVFWWARGASTPFLAFAVIGAGLVELRYRRGHRELALSAVAGFAAGAAYLAGGRGFGGFFGSVPIGVLAFFGLGSLLVLGVRAVRATEDLKPFMLAMFCPLLMTMVTFALAASIAALPRVYDPYLYLFDGSLGGQPAFAVGQWFAAWPWLQNTCFVVYSSLPLAATVLFLSYLDHPERMTANAFTLFLGAGALGFALYFICPAVGPLHVFLDKFPMNQPATVPLATIPVEMKPRNAMPSLHAAWAMLIWWNLRRRSRGTGWGAALFLVFTLLATLGFGEHYLIDLVVAAPFALAIQAGAQRHWPPAVASLAVTIAWVTALRYGWQPEPPLAGVAVIVTLALTAAGASRLDRSAVGASEPSAPSTAAPTPSAAGR